MGGVYTDFCVSGSFGYVHAFILLEVFYGVIGVWMGRRLEVFFIRVEEL
jgi:hypothetical protein